MDRKYAVIARIVMATAILAVGLFAQSQGTAAADPWLPPDCSCNPTPGYPVEGYPASSGVEKDYNFQGTRQTSFPDLGRITLGEAQSGSATIATATVTKSMIDKGTPSISQGSQAINPPGIETATGGYVIRGHLISQRFGGLGGDVRNIVALTRSANALMYTRLEGPVYDAFTACTDPGSVTYTSQPLYGNGYGKPPTLIVMSAHGPCGIDFPSVLIPNGA